MQTSRWLLVGVSAVYTLAVLGVGVWFVGRYQGTADTVVGADGVPQHMHDRHHNHHHQQRAYTLEEGLKQLLLLPGSSEEQGEDDRPRNVPRLHWEPQNSSVVAGQACQHCPVEIPRIIHQTWKTEELPYLAQSSVESWQRLNKGYEYRFYTDDDIAAYMEKNHPNLVNTWNRMKPIHRADLFRYVILHDVGGYYADIDVTLQTPLDDWPLKHNIHYSAAVIVGFEIITQRPDWKQWFSRQYQMCQWTMAAAPGHEIFARTIGIINENFKSLSDTDIETMSAVKLTGPAVWSDAVTSHLHDHYGVAFGQGMFTDDRLRDNYVLIGDVLLMPMRSFAVGSAGYFPPSSFEWSDQLVTHGFQGSWKKNPNPQYVDFGQEEAVIPFVPLERTSTAVLLSAKYGIQGQPSTPLTSPYMEPLENLFDGSTDTKWLGYHDFTGEAPPSANVTIALYPRQYAQLREYELVSGNDMPNRDPVTWQVVCVGEHDVETVIHSNDGAVFTDRVQAKAFRVAMMAVCRSFVFVFKQVVNPHKVDCLQLTALRLTDLTPARPSEPECESTSFGQLCTCCTLDIRGSEGAMNVLDESLSTHWKASWPAAISPDDGGGLELRPSLRFVFSGGARRVSGYELAPAGDERAMDPAAWRVVGKRDEKEQRWEQVDIRSGAVFEERAAPLRFHFEQTRPFAVLEWQLLSAHNSTHPQCVDGTRFCVQLARFSWLFDDEDGQAESNRQ
ncbi:hypothetical protein PTSG_02506 [Salpingoeca rosetta]|uniref:Uncharacterized protein n=1 Tax=Salpingoeca rosetta (strain ATCC 50818 / BSB-021) TaxID=946362 RepID=F2U2E2_SALR5|nr:uncharacterized protein PTSG_02506 [Salpingoeca rosetta]EGD81794.1 hypothetical protein PTSG_02506 [Salpingoeca rosetta]|eukprot:XP_004996998.1 hypothetical protein PTSG_02506 [Salpingoeca rosetta]